MFLRPSCTRQPMLLRPVCASGDDCCSLDVDEIVARAVRAQHQFAGWNERQIDDVLEHVAESVALAADDLARYATDETGMGNARDKSIKISFASRTVQQDLKGRPAAGILHSRQVFGHRRDR